jgi:hypothetical protein
MKQNIKLHLLFITQKKILQKKFTKLIFYVANKKKESKI